MTEDLTDKEDFPRSDIDIFSARSLRHQIICLQTDHGKLMKEIEKSLHKMHTKAQVVETFEKTVISTPDDTFLIVKTVDSNSPAKKAGLMPEDEIIQFGSLRYQNFQDMKSLKEIVETFENKIIIVKIKRKEKTEFIKLIPRRWSGSGLLGCFFIKKT